LKEGTLPDDQKRAYAIPHEANQYVLMNDVLYHLFTKRLRKNVKETDIIQQLAVPTSLRNDIVLSYHDSIATGCHMGVQKTYEAVKYFPLSYPLV
jgi:glutathionylspermidine synthase